MMISSGRWQDYLISKRDLSSYSKKVIFTLGKGGTGKTTASTALAASLVEKGHKVLLVSLDPAHNVGDLLGVNLGDEVRKIRDNFFALEVDLEKSIKTYLKRTRRELKSIYSYLQIFNMDNYFDLLQDSPGIEEYALLERMIEILDREKYEYIIIDTAPTGVTLRVLSLPHITMKWIENLIKLRLKLLEKRKMIENVDGPRYINIGGDKIELPSREEDDFVLGGLTDYYKRVEWIYRLINTSDITSGLIVMNPDRLSLLETGRIMKKLTGQGVSLKLMIVNKAGKNVFTNNTGLKELKNRYQDIKWLVHAELENGLDDMDGLLKMGEKILAKLPGIDNQGK